jgi:hypothetical protein
MTIISEENKTEFYTHYPMSFEQRIQFSYTQFFLELVQTFPEMCPPCHSSTKSSVFIIMSLTLQT